MAQRLAHKVTLIVVGKAVALMDGRGTADVNLVDLAGGSRIGSPRSPPCSARQAVGLTAVLGPNILVEGEASCRSVAVATSVHTPPDCAPGARRDQFPSPFGGVGSRHKGSPGSLLAPVSPFPMPTIRLLHVLAG